MATIRWCPIFPKWDSYQPLFNSIDVQISMVSGSRCNRDSEWNELRFHLDYWYERLPGLWYFNARQYDIKCVQFQKSRGASVPLWVQWKSIDLVRWKSLLFDSLGWRLILTPFLRESLSVLRYLCAPTIQQVLRSILNKFSNRNRKWGAQCEQIVFWFKLKVPWGKLT